MLHLVPVLVTLVGLAAAGFDPELHEKYLTMPRDSFIEYFNNQNYSWKMGQYDHFIKDEYLACVHNDSETRKLIPLVTHNLETIKGLPENFDSRQQWPQCETIKEIYDQGDCGSCWTFGVATTASDRTCIHAGLTVRLAEQDFECLQRARVCSGGYPDKAFLFWQRRGLVTQQCKPYNIEKLKKNKCEKQCVTSEINYEQDKHLGAKIYRVPSEREQVKAELVKNGPIETVFAVLEDFTNYTSGIYEHKFGKLLGYHSVRVIGYGTENGVDYWLAANSWGKKWGDRGLFRVKAYQEDVDFENFLTGIPKK